MAKRKNKRKKVETVERSAFWGYAGAVALVLLAFFMLLGSFGTGGPLPVKLFDGTEWLFGVAAFLTPAALFSWGVWKFASEERRIPLIKLASMLTFLFSASAWAHVAFAEKAGSGFQNGEGGHAGQVIGGVALQALNKMPASIMFFVASVLFFMLAYGISPKIFLNIIEWYRREPEEGEEEIQDLAQLKKRSPDHEFKLNEGVPVEHHSGRDARHSSLKNTAAKLGASEDHDALTIASDPNWVLPGLELLSQKQDKADAGNVEGNAEIIRETLEHFNIPVEMEGANIGPRVTQYTLKPPTGVKLTKITALDNNLALDLAAHSIRIEAPIPGKRLVGIEVPNVKSATVRLASIFQSKEWIENKSPLAFAIGKDISGSPIVGDLDKMPHLLVAGQTGSGKSVMINDILTSFLYRNSPSDLKLILVDPKQVELKPYDAIPHLLTPVITEPEKCISALKWTVAEMERRYKALSSVNKRNIGEYNKLKTEEGMPYIVVVIDELADLMMMAARDVEALIVRIAQKARAVGIHLVLATQRPSVDVITGLIKANVPGRIGFTTNSQVDSRTILDQVGAEKLLGRGDMLLATAELPKPIRVQAALIEDDETNSINDFIRQQREPQYDDEVVSQPVQLNGKGGVVADYGGGEADDDMWKDAVGVVVEAGKASTSLLQRRLRIGYGRAARIIETMEEQGIVGPADGSRPREVLVTSLDQVFGASSANNDIYDDPETMGTDE